MWESRRSLIIAGVETSCDDTAIGIVETDGTVLANVVASQLSLHHEYGGIVPHLAARAHEKNLPFVAKEAMNKAGISWEDVDVICVTTGPGLVPCLRTGVKFALEKAIELNKPILSINHLVAHVLMSRMFPDSRCEFPFQSLVVSGGHSCIVQVDDYETFTVVGTTHDDAMGEAFDKVARMLKLDNGAASHAGKLLEEFASRGDRNMYKLPVPLRRNVGQPDFSFSGLKSAVSRLIPENLSTIEQEDIAASFQSAAVEHAVNVVRRSLVFAGCMPKANEDDLPWKLRRQVGKDVTRRENVAVSRELTIPTSLVVSGGVASNGYLRAELQHLASHFDIPVFFPPPKFCTDNGVMIAWAGCEMLRGGKFDLEKYKLDSSASVTDILRSVVRARWPLDKVKNSSRMPPFV